MTRAREATSGQSTRTASAAPDALAFIEESLGQPFEPDEIRIITVPVAGDPLALLDATAPAVFWAAPDGATLAGVGSAHTVVARGARRFPELRERARELWSRVRPVSSDGRPPVPRLLGGVSFLPGAHSGPWRPFDDAAFVLPRFLVSDDDAGLRLSVAVTDPGQDGDRAGLLAEVGRVIERTEAGGTDPDDGARPAPAGYDAPGEPADAASWIRAVHSVREWIEDGRAEKIVAARREVVPLEAGEGLTRAVLRRLAREPTAFRFGFRHGDATFVGATPERLVRSVARDVRTEALAGTVAAGEEARLAPLLESVKEGAEHAFVVRAIADALEPVCEWLRYPATPEVQRLRHVHHLRTPFLGRLDRDIHVLELVERLHPTPAVGGWPTEAALRWIRDHEPGDRGWYAAPVGWMDARGDGEFAVALRSALLHEDRAHVYAGAGIVADSDAEAELRETEVKLRTMKEALGVP